MEFEIIKDLHWGGGRESGNTGYQKLFKMNDRYYVASQVDLEDEWETMVFAANENGQVVNWSDLWCRREDKPTDLTKLIGEAVNEYSTDQMD
jgi:hypothetical protein